jgi:signal transduction histidine kinase
MTRLGQRLKEAGENEALELALSSFLELCDTQCGLILRASDAVYDLQVGVCWNASESLADLLAAHQPLRDRLPAGQTLGLAQLSAQGRRKNKQLTPLEEALATAHIDWFAWLPLPVEGEVRAVLVALGVGERAQALEQPVAHVALTLLAELSSAALQRVQLQARMLSEARARDEFIGLASHELKSPLTIIKGYSQLMLRKARHEQAERSGDVGSLEAINQQVGRMSSLINELLDVSRIDRGMLEVVVHPVELVGLVQKALGARQRAHSAEMIRLVQCPAPLMVQADPARVEQVLGVLLDNALKFGGGLRPVEVSIELVPAEQVPPAPRVPGVEMLPVARQGQVARIAVCDYGLGLPVEERRYLFTPFYRGPENSMHRQLAGLGLGLYLSAYLVARQHGSIWADFSEEHGMGSSSFYLALPLVPQH